MKDLVASGVNAGTCFSWYIAGALSGMGIVYIGTATGYLGLVTMLPGN